MRKIAVVLYCLMLCLKLFAQPGTEDQSYNPRSFHKTLTGQAYAVVVEADDRILIGGDITSTETTSSYIYRLNSDRTLDQSFLAGAGVNKAVFAIIKQPDGKLLVGGDFEVFGGQATGGIIRLMADGSIDPSFVTGQGVTLAAGYQSYVEDIRLQPDGKIILSGVFDLFNGIARNRVVRLNADGTLDTTFDPGAGVYAETNTQIRDVLVQPDGKILIAGLFSEIGGIPYTNLARLNSNGTLDTTFHNLALGQYDIIHDVEFYGSGLIISGGFEQFINNGSSFYSPRICRLTSNGNVNTSFVSAINGGLGYIGLAMRIMDDQSILLSLSGIGISRISTAGTILASGTPGQMVTGGWLDGSIYAFDLNSHKDIVCVGNFESDPNSTATMCNSVGFMHSDLSTDATASGLGATIGYQMFSPVVHDVVVLPDNRSVIIGEHTHYNNIPFNGITRLLEKGHIDTTFHAGVGFDQSSEGPVTMALQSDGKLIVGGAFDTYNGLPFENLVRLLPDGAPDVAFQSAGVSFANHFPSGIIVQPDGKIMIAGEGIVSAGVTRRDIIRLKADGSLDTSFNAGLAASYIGNVADVLSIAMQADGKYLCGGRFLTFNGQSAHGLVRLNTNGSVDTSFHTGTGFLSFLYDPNYHVSVVKVQSNGKILVGGNFVAFNGTPVGKIVRLNTDGSIDSTFINSTNTIYDLYDIFVQPDGKILVVGSLSSFSGMVANQMVLLNADGSLLLNFSGPDYSGNAVAVQSDGKILVAGSGYEGSLWPYDNIYRGIYRFNNEPDFLAELDIAVEAMVIADCQQSGVAVIASVNGVPPFSYSWNNEPASSDSSFTYTNPGIYSATVTDATSASVSTNVLLEAPLNQSSHDLTVNIVTTSFRPGFESLIFTNALNQSCTSASGQLKVKLDDALNFMDAAPAPDIISGDTLIWNFSAMSYTDPHLMPLIRVQMATSAQIGDSIELFVIIDPVTGDSDTTDNLRHYLSPVINGYDPNDKNVYPAGTCVPHYVHTDQRLTYSVRFQNTGNSEAVNIVVEDVIDENLDLSTLHIVGYSDPMHTEITSGNHVRFVFEGIHLPDSTSNQEGSHGYVIFEVDPVSGQQNGTEIHNSADIYFDYNAPIITNTVFNTLTDTGHFAENETVTISSCDSLTWNGNTYYESGQYAHYFQNSYGCDSVVQLDLTINHSPDSVLAITALDLVEINGVSYIQSGTYTQVLISAEGCEGTLVIDLEMNFTALSEFSNGNMYVYPNPSEGELFLRVDEVHSETSYSLVNMQATVVIPEKKMAGALEYIDLKALPPGAYFLHVSNAEGEADLLVIKAKN